MKNQMRLLNVLVAIAIVLGMAFSGGAPRPVQALPSAISLSTVTPVTQNFDGIGISATATTPADWKVDKNASAFRAVGTYAAAATITGQVGGNNMSGTAANGIYNYGAGDPATATDRAIGFLSSGSATKSGNLYAYFNNGTGTPLSALTISYNVEKYRTGTNAAGYSIQMYYSFDGSVWTSAGANFLTSFPADSTTAGYASAPGATTAVSAQTLTVAIPSGSDFYLAWNYSVTSGSTTTYSQGLAVDDFWVLAIGGGGSTNPSGVGSANPTVVVPGDTSLLTVAVTPGTNPASTGLGVSCNLTAIGGSATQAFAPAGGDSFTFSATVDGATTPGAKSLRCTINDTEGRPGSATIALTVYAVVPIGTVNGPIPDGVDATTHNAALMGQTVAVQGVIYEKTLQAISNSTNTYKGFFIQNTSETKDSDVNTSDGLFVFMSTAGTISGPSGSYTPKVGDEVVLSGVVSEYYNMTELTGPTLLSAIVRTGVDIDTELVPFPVDPPVSLFDANIYWERHQGMRAAIKEDSIVLSGRSVFSPADAEIWVARPDTPPDSPIALRTNPYERRAFRDAHPLDDNPLAGWDGNGYRIVMGSLGIKGVTGDAQALLDPARTFDTVTNETVGGINYSFSKYRVEVTTQPILNDGVDPAANNPPTTFNRVAGYSIVDYNLENLYDYRNNPNSNCDFPTDTGCPIVAPFLAAVSAPFDYVPASIGAYTTRLNDIALQIINDLHSPDILMVQEVENQDFCTPSGSALNCVDSSTADGKPDVLQDLALNITALGGPAYDAAFDHDSSDLRGIAPAFLYRTDRVQLASPVGDPLLGTTPAIIYPGAGVPANADISNPKTLNAFLPTGIATCETSWVFPRAPDIALFQIYPTSVGVGDPQNVYIINNHFKSGPDTCVAHRTEQAKYNAAIAAFIESAVPGARIVLGGDLNVYPRPDDPFAPIGQPTSSDQLAALYASYGPLTHAPSGIGDVVLKNLWEVELKEAPEGAYSYGYLGMAQTLDQMFISPSMLADLAQFRIVHINSDFPADYPGDVARGTSDHDPNLAVFGFNSPTAVNVLGLKAQKSTGGVRLSWQSTMEEGIAGFNVYRSPVGESTLEKLNGAPIQVQFPGSTLGADYQWLYPTTQAGTGYEYWVEVLLNAGGSDMIGPVDLSPSYFFYLPRVLSRP